MRIVLIGTSDHAGVVMEIAQAEGRHKIVGACGPGRLVGSDFHGVPVLGDDDALATIVDDNNVAGFFVAIGDNVIRARVQERIRLDLPGLEAPALIHPAATLASDVILGPGSVIMPGAMINPGCQIGHSCIINTRASLDHDSVLEEYASLGPGVTTGGRVRIDRFTAICLGANILHGCKVGAHSVVGAGSLVTRDIPGGVVAYGSPARVIRGRKEGEPYL